MKTRLPYNAETPEDMQMYYMTRARQLQHEGYELHNLDYYTEDRVMIATFHHNDECFHSIYIPPSQKGKGMFQKYYRNFTMITMDECDLIPFFIKHQIPYVSAGKWLSSLEEYTLVSEYYGNRVANRTQVFYMNHIDEGITILKDIGASDAAIRGYCLHPLLQDDADFAKNLHKLSHTMTSTDAAFTIGLAVEYRSVANEYLSRKTMNPQGIRLSPLKDVNDMLIADKIQNCKDYEIYHQATIPNSIRLAEYFKEWRDALNVSETMYLRFKERLDIKPRIHYYT